jgi:hypothetical protein
MMPNTMMIEGYDVDELAGSGASALPSYSNFIPREDITQL